MRELKHENQKGLFIVIFVALFFSSILGAQLFGVSLNKIALLPLECYLIYVAITKGKIIEFKISMYPILLFYVVQILGSLFGLLNVEYAQTYDGYRDTLINNIIQNILIYFPIVLLIGQMNNKQQLYYVFKKCIVYVARIHLCWIIVQFLLWNMFQIDFNAIIFQDLLKGKLGDDFGSTVIFLNDKVELRATGLNYEPAAAATVMMLGICFDRRIALKIMYALGTVLGMSRTGIVVAIICLIIQLALGIYTKKFKIKTSNLLYLIILSAFCVILLFMFVPSLSNQLFNLIDRFTNMGTNNDGSERHIMYPIYSLYSWAVDLNIYQKFFGVGARVSGIVFAESPYVSSNMTFHGTMLSEAWEVECDYAAIMLGDGAIGVIAYLWIISKYIRSRDIDCVTLGIAVLCFGLMYNTFSSTLFQIVTIFFLTTKFSKKQVKSSELLASNSIKYFKFIK